MGALVSWAKRADEVVTTEVNFFEISLGIELEVSRANQARIAANWADLLSYVEMLPLTRRAVQTAVRRQAVLYRSGRPAALADLLIAATARAAGCGAIVTRDADDFARIGLVPPESH